MPYPNEHAARVRDPGDFQPDSFRRKTIAPGVDVILGRLKGQTTMTAQAYRFDAGRFSAAEARKWLKDNDVTAKSFEPAAPKKAAGASAAAPALGEIALCCSLSIDAAEKDADGQAKKGPRRFSMDAYNGGELTIDNYPLPVYIDISGLRVPRETMPAYYGHPRPEPRIVGHTDKHDKTDGKRFLTAGAISGATEWSRQVLDSHDAGFPWQASVSAMPVSGKLVEIREGKTAQVNGRTVEGPVIIARASTLRHIAFVPEGADASTSVSIAASAANPKTEVVSMEFTEWVEALGFELSALTEAQQTALKTKYDAEIKAAAKKDGGDPPVNAGANDGGKKTPTGAPPPTFDLPAVSLACEKHTAMIQAETAAYTGKIDSAKLNELSGKAGQAAAEMKAKALNEEWPATRVEVEAIKAQSAYKVELIRAERPATPVIHASSRDASPAVIEAALCLSAGFRRDQAERVFDARTLEAADRDFRGIGIQELLLMQAEANGYTVRRRRIDRGNLREVLHAAFPMQAGPGASTLSLPGIFSNVANKFLLAGYDAVEQVWRMICSIRPVNDFKTLKSYRLTGDFQYEEVGPTGELAHGKVGEEEYTISAKTYGKIFVLSRTDIINDDLGAFDTIRQRLGRGGALKLNAVFWAAFLNNSTFFTSGRGNYFEGAATALSIDSLGTAVQMFRDLVDPDGHPLGTEPVLLLVPSNLEATARGLYVSEEFRDTTASTKRTVANIYRNLYKPLVSTYLNKSAFTGYSTTAWYLLADPADRPTIEVCFLNGQESPTVESADADFDTLGVAFRGYHDFGVALKEWLGGVKSKGAA